MMLANAQPESRHVEGEERDCLFIGVRIFSSLLVMAEDDIKQSPIT
jgi:hypothetical protein